MRKIGEFILAIMFINMGVYPIFASDIPGIKTPIPIIPSGANNCLSGYYTYGQSLNPLAPVLDDLFAGRAHFQSSTEAEEVTIGGNGRDHNKIPILFNQADQKYYGFTRGYIGYGDKTYYNIFLMVSNDGVNFTKVGPIFSQAAVQSQAYLGLYDAHIAIDYSVCPTRYYMTFECGGSYCASSSIDPFKTSTWSEPVRVVDSVMTSDGKNAGSGSTPVILIEGSKKYTSWTAVDDVNTSAYSKGLEVQDPLAYVGKSTNIGKVVLPAEPNTHCTSIWDCNNRDKHDWKKEGDYYYLVYSGANFYGCDRRGESGTNDWGVGIVRSTKALEGYNLAGVGKIIDSEVKDTCGVEYPVINAINGELYLYYGITSQTSDGNRVRVNRRSKLVWNPGFPLPVIGDVNGDRIVNLVDFSLWKQEYTKKVTTKKADFNNDGVVNLVDFSIWKREYIK